MCFVAAALCAVADLNAQQPQLTVRQTASQQVRLSWAASASGFVLESASSLAAPIAWKALAAAPEVQAGESVVLVSPAGASQYFRLRQTQTTLTRIVETSPAQGEGNVAVTRETIIRLSAPLAANALVGNERLYAEFGGRRLLSRVELATDRRTVTLFYLEPLPGRARIRVTFNADGLNDLGGQAVDADGDGGAGGKLLLDFDTLANGGVAGTVVTGRVFASELAQAAAAHGQLVNRPLAGVRITVDGKEQDLIAVSDSNGNFRLDPAPAGSFFVHIDGRTVNVPGGGYPTGPFYPFVGKEWNSRIGEEINIGDIFLPLIREETLQPVSASQDTAITFPAAVLQQNPALAGVQITIPANALFRDDGLRGGLVGVAPVAPDRLPGPLPAGLSFPLVITVQTDGASNFDRPVPVCFPNLPDPATGALLPPGAKSALWSFNHDLGDWEVVGPMTVSADGKLVCSDPGTGILQPGWHGSGSGTTGTGGNTRSGNPRGPSRPRPTGPQECVHNDCPCDSDCNSGRAVYYQNGEEVFTRTDLQIPGRGGMDFVLQRTYRSRLDFNGPLGYGWNFRYNETLFVEANGDVVRYNGRSHEGAWKLEADGTYAAPPGYFSILIRQTDGAFVLTEPDGFQRIYREDGRMIMQADRFGNRMLFDYDARGNLARVIDVYGREIRFEFSAGADGVDRLTMVEDFAGRRVTYRYDAQGDLVNVTSPAVTGTSTANDFPEGRTEQYTYSSGFAAPELNHNLLSVTAPEEVALGGPARLQWTYGTDPASAETFDRVLTETEGGVNASGIAAGGTTRFEYQALNAGALPGQLDLPRAKTRVTERNGNVKEYFINEHSLHISVREYTKGLRAGEPAYHEIRSAHDQDGQVVRRQYAEGNEVRYVYDSTGPRRNQANLLEMRRVADADRGGGNDLVTTYTYEPLFNQVLTVTEPRGNDPGYTPPLGSRSAARYTKRFYYDYQESTATVPLASLFGVDLSRVPRGLGDLNGDNRIDQQAGKLVRVEAPAVTLSPESKEAARRGAAAQTIISQTQWNDHGQVAARIDPEGNVTDYLYHPEDDPEGDGEETFAPYLALGSTAAGYLKSVVVDSRGSPRRGADAPPPLAITTSYLYDGVGNVIGMIDPRGVRTQIEVNQLNEIVTVTRGAEVSAAVASRQLLTGEAPLRYRSRYHYDRNSRVVRTELENRDGSAAGLGEFVDHTFVYDILDNLVTRRAEASAAATLATQYRYDPNELLATVTQPENTVTRIAYDERNLPFLVTRGFGSAQASTLQFDYDSNGNRLRVIDAEDDDGDGRSGVISYSYDGFDRQIQWVDALGNQHLTAYDPASNPVRDRVMGHPPGRPDAANVLLRDSVLAYDEVNRVFRVDAALFLAEGFAASRPVQFEDGNADGYVTTLQEFDALSRLTFVIEDDGEVTQTRYDGAGRVVEITDALGNRRITEYDRNSNPVRLATHEIASGGLVPPESFALTYVYDQLDRLVRATDNAGQTAQFTYDARGNLLLRSDAEGAVMADPLGLVPAGINAPGNTTAYTYDGLSRLIDSISHLRAGGAGGGASDNSNPANADGTVTVRYEWDGNSRLAGITDDNGNRSSFAYDALDRRVAQIHADGTRSSFSFSKDDNLVQITDPNGTVVRRSYDELNRPVQAEVTALGEGVAGTRVETYAYDGLSRLTRATDDNGSVLRAQDFERIYDSLSRLVEERQNGRAVSTAFAGDGRRLSLTYPSGRRVDKRFDGLDRVRELADAKGKIAEFAWIGQRQRELLRVHGNGTALSMLGGAAGNQDAGYDAVQRLVRQRLLARDGTTVLLDREYGYNRANQRTFEKRHDDGGLTDRSTYDSAYRITRSEFDQAAAAGAAGAPLRAVRAAEYRMDGAGNRRQVTATGAAGAPGVTEYSVNNLNEYTSVGAARLLHSNNGNLRDDGQRLYTYDWHNRLVAVARKSDGAPIAEYLYDAANRRRQKIVRRADNPAVIQSQTLYYYDRWQVCEEQNAAGATETTYVYAPNYIDRIVQLERGATHALGAGGFYLHQNARNDVVALSDAAGALVEKRFYDDFGRSFDESKQGAAVSALGNPFGFQGQRFDPETGFYYCRERYYDPETGRYLQRDPVWDPLNSGNQYTFAGNNPASRLDPFGLNGNPCRTPPRGNGGTSTRPRPYVPRREGPPIQDDGATDVTTGVRTAAAAVDLAARAHDASAGVRGAREAAAAFDTWQTAWQESEFASNMAESIGGNVQERINEATASINREQSALRNLERTSYSSATEGQVRRANAARTAGKAAAAVGAVAQVAEVAVNAVDYYHKDERVQRMSASERERILNEYDRLSREALTIRNPCLQEKLIRDLRENMEFQLNNVTDSQITEHLINGAVFVRDSLATFIPLPTGWLWGNATEEAGRR